MQIKTKNNLVMSGNVILHFVMSIKKHYSKSYVREFTLFFVRAVKWVFRKNTYLNNFSFFYPKYHTQRCDRRNT